MPDPSRFGTAFGRTPILISVAIGLFAGDVSAGGTGAPLSSTQVAAAGACGGVLLLLWQYPAWRRVAIGLLAFGYAFFAAHRMYHPTFAAEHVAHVTGRAKWHVAGLIVSEPEVREKGAQLRIAIGQIEDRDGWRTAQGDVLVTVRRVSQPWTVGDRIRARLSLRRPRNFGNPGEFDYEGYLARRGIYVTAFATDDAGFERIASDAPLSLEPLMHWRRRVAALFDRELNETNAGVMKALIVGTPGAVSRDLLNTFSRAGVSHVLSISGLHIGLVVATGYALFRWLLARSRSLLLLTNVPKLAVGLSVVPVVLYAGIAGSNVATLRSVIMVVVVLAAVAIDRQRNVLVSLAVSAIAIVLWMPGTGRDVSFQLSFAAVIGLVLGLERFWPWWRRYEEERLVRLRGWRGRLWRHPATYGAVSVSALASTLPLTAFHFNQVSPIALLANAAVVPILGSLAVALGLLAAALEPLARPLAQLCVWVAGPFLTFGIWSVKIAAAIPGAAWRVPAPTVPELLLLYAALLVAVLLSGVQRFRTLVLLALLIGVDEVWSYVERHTRDDLRVTFLSVGQGDSAVVELPGGEVMVIDGGGLMSQSFDVGERVIAPFLWDRRILRVDYLVLSHPQWDHYGGLLFLARHFQPRQFWTAGMSASSPRFTELEGLLQQYGVQRVVLRRGAVREAGPVTIAVHSPPEAIEGLKPNDLSLVLSLTFAGERVLFSGDIEALMERKLVAAQGDKLASAILKVPHHGSRTSSTAGFLAAVSPHVAIASLGFENHFGFPHAEVIERYRDRAIRLARTDRDGAVELRVRGDGYTTLRTYRRPSEIDSIISVLHASRRRIGVDSVASEG